jgi:hypothetical protein
MLAQAVRNTQPEAETKPPPKTKKGRFALPTTSGVGDTFPQKPLRRPLWAARAA